MQLEFLIEHWVLSVHLNFGGLLLAVEQVLKSFQFDDDKWISDVSLGRLESSRFDDSKVEWKGVG